jgi:hypothetical protein
VSKVVTASSPEAARLPLVLTGSEVVPDELVAVPVWSSRLEVAAPRHSLSWPSELAPEEPVLNATDEMPEETFASYQISSGPVFVPARHT